MRCSQRDHGGCKHAGRPALLPWRRLHDKLRPWPIGQASEAQARERLHWWVCQTVLADSGQSGMGRGIGAWGRAPRRTAARCRLETRCAADAGCGAAGQGRAHVERPGWAGARPRCERRLTRHFASHACPPGQQCGLQRGAAAASALTCRLPPGRISCCTRSMLLAMPSSARREPRACARQKRPSTSSSPRAPAIYK